MKLVDERENTAANRPLLEPIEVDAFLDGVDALPASPYPLPELFKALSDPDADLTHVVDLISSDPGLTTNLLKLCNSAYLARGKAVNNVTEAVNRLGFRAVYRVVAAIKSPQLFKASKGSEGIPLHEIWKHSVVTALACQYMADDFGEDSGVLFTAGLLHDLGKVLFCQKLKERYRQVIVSATENQQALSVAESNAFGVEHGHLGARLLERWNFSQELVYGVRFHHQPHQAENFEKLAAIVQVASLFSHNYYPCPTPAGLPAEAEAGLHIFGWSVEELNGYSRRVNENMTLLTAMLQMVK